MKSIDLRGIWKYKLQEQGDFQTGFVLPGTTCENKIGKKQEWYEELTKETVRAPRENYEYIGKIWLEREIDVPKEAEGKAIWLFLERVNMASKLWIDGVLIGREIVELSTPHIYSLTGKLTAGKHRMTIEVDNQNLLNIDTMASGYSVDTQGYWNGIIGEIKLCWEEIFHIGNVQIYSKENGIKIRLVAENDVKSPLGQKEGRLEIWSEGADGEKGELLVKEIKLYNSKQVEYLQYEISDIRWWNEFDPYLYTLHLRFSCDGIVTEKLVRFGMRIQKVVDKEFTLNGKPIALRGTTDCAIHPLTGYPPMEKADWRKKFQTVKDYGLNHVRFHAWCPPEAAFEAADEMGVYLSVEMPLWLNQDVCALEVGEDPIHRSYYTNEALLISKTYGNHPSFLMFSCGNENMGDMELLEDIIIQMKAYDERRFYTLTSNFDRPMLPVEDYLCAYEANGKKIRMQNLQEEASKDTSLDYTNAVREMEVPIVSFEIGQYCSYPDVDIMEKYTGNMLPVNYDVIRKEMKKKGVYHRLEEYQKASGDLSVKLYKEEIECALRTEKFGGFELLALCDYTGQDTAVVGILDAFGDSKGWILPEEFRQFCNEVVPLFLAKRIFLNSECVKAELKLYDYGKHLQKQPEFIVSVYREEELFYQCTTKENEIQFSLEGIDEASILIVEVKVAQTSYQNRWRIFVLPERQQEKEVSLPIVSVKTELDEIIQNGGSAIVTADYLKHYVEGSFIPVFWSPVFFPSSNPCGGIISKQHPIFKDFPTEKYPDYQWKTLFDHAKAVDISCLGNPVTPIVEFVPNYVDNTQSSPLLEVQVGKARILFCGFDLTKEDRMTKQLKYSIASYVQSELFEPKEVLSSEELYTLLQWT